MPGDPTNPSGFAAKKKVDESWKDAVTKEKTGDSPEPDVSRPGTFQHASFPFFISTLGMQALVSLGELPDPATHEKVFNAEQAKYLIDILEMLSEKTKGSLLPEEASMMSDLLYELRVKFVQKNQQA